MEQRSDRHRASVARLAEARHRRRRGGPSFRRGVVTGHAILSKVSTMKTIFHLGQWFVRFVALRLPLGLLVMLAIVASGCDRVDQKKFDAMYRAGKALEVDIDNSSSVRIPVSEMLLKQFKTEMALLKGRTAGKKEEAALRAYDDAADAYQSFLYIRDMDLRGEAREGRMLLGEGWVARGSKFNFVLETAPSEPTDKYKFYWVNVGAVVTALLAGFEKNMTEANRLVNGA